MTSNLQKALSKATTSLAIFFIFSVHVSAFSLTNCTVSGALNDTRVLKVLCYKMGFFTVPSPIPIKARHLDISFNSISNIRLGDFEDLWNLRSINLSNSHVSWIEDGTAEHFPNLIDLNLANNKLRTISRGLLHGLGNLQVLRLDRNMIWSIDAFAFNTLQNIRVLNLTGNNLKHIANVRPVLSSQGLEVLYIASNNFDVFNSWDLSRTPLSLKSMVLSNNPLTKFEITDNIFPKLDFLDLSHCGQNSFMLWNLTDKTFLNSVKTLNLSGVRISEENIAAVLHNVSWSSLFKLKLNELKQVKVETLLRYACLPGLSVLRMQRNRISNLTAHELEPCSNMTELDFGDNEISRISTPIFKEVTQLRNTFADDDSITAEVFHPLPKLTKLIISRAQIRSLNFLVKAKLVRLSTLRAPGNVLDVINQAVILSLPRLKFLDLQKNTFTCDCNNFYFINWALESNSTQVIYMNDYTCGYPLSVKGKSILELNTESCNVNIDFVMFVCSSVVVTATLLISFIYQFLHWQVLYAYYLFVAFLYDSKRKETRQHAYKYDAFISYNARDEAWVVDELLPHLEGEQGWRLCLHHRDFEPGRPIIDNIMDGIYSSRKTICLITYDYLMSTWCSKEIQMANFRLFDEQKDVLILIFLEDIPSHQLSPYYQMRKLVKKKTYLKWPKPGEDTRVFWQKLRMALGTKEGPEEEKAVLSTQGDYPRNLL
ncbi:hypothetical protein KOW79_015699 [Hemibagrus wyckioides]|uniref:TIR domain-containing protein n=1 Tax=Hemibagrus wyckioides TaxID=337641 RepID=A0A9D3NGM7_9TELE|nr:hypothetical protein KOW79_015699 [Hemibagrus wyckioides]